MTRLQLRNLCDEITANYTQDASKEKTVEQLKEVRNYFKEIKDPIITKVVRLVYEHLEANSSFDIEFDEMEFDNEADRFKYFVQLVKQYDNPLNKEELTSLKDQLAAQ
jgi:hypothetical protein